MRRLWLLVGFLIAGCFARILSSQVVLSDDGARILAMHTVERATQLKASDLNTKRREDLEDELFSFQEKVAGHFERKAYVYEVSNGGYHLDEGQLSYSSPTKRWLVAVSTGDDNLSYGLGGFTDGEVQFDALMLKIRAAISNRAQAELLARLYLDIVWEESDNIVYEELRLRHKVEEHFVGYSDSQEALSRKEARYRTWWRGFETLKIDDQLAPTTACDGSGECLAVFNIVSMTVGRPPELWRYSIKVRPNGTVHLSAHVRVFPVEPPR